MRTAEIVAERAAMTLASLRLRDSLREQSVRDPLTKLFNRRYLEETFKRELVAATRRDTPLALMIVDVDHFKLLNDTQGHGDAVLSELGALLSSSFRASDVVCRYGGEEARRRATWPNQRLDWCRSLSHARTKCKRVAACGGRGTVPRQGGRPRSKEVAESTADVAAQAR